MHCIVLYCNCIAGQGEASEVREEPFRRWNGFRHTEIVLYCIPLYCIVNYIVNCIIVLQDKERLVKLEKNLLEDEMALDIVQEEVQQNEFNIVGEKERNLQLEDIVDENAAHIRWNYMSHLENIKLPLIFCLALPRKLCQFYMYKTQWVKNLWGRRKEIFN